MESHLIHLWLEENHHFFKGLAKGVIYTAFENDEVLLSSNANIKRYWRKENDKRITFLASEKLNKKICEIAICDQDGCNEHKAGKYLKTATCEVCKTKLNNERIRLKYHKVKAGYVVKPQNVRKPKPLTAQEIAFNITGYYPMVYREDSEYLFDKFDEIERRM